MSSEFVNNHNTLRVVDNIVKASTKAYLVPLVEDDFNLSKRKA